MDFSTIFTSIYIVNLLLLTFICVFDKKRLGLVSVSLFSHRMLSQLLRDGKYRNDWFSFFSYTLIILTHSLLFLTVIYHTFPNIMTLTSAWVMFFVCMLIVLLYHFIVMVGIWSYKLFFSAKIAAENIALQRLFCNISITLLLMVLLPVFFYHKLLLTPIFIPLVFPVIIYLTSLLRINLGRVDLFHFFIYFCTLEILPVFIIGKVLLTIDGNL